VLRGGSARNQSVISPARGHYPLRKGAQYDAGAQVRETLSAEGKGRFRKGLPWLQGMFARHSIAKSFKEEETNHKTSYVGMSGGELLQREKGHNPKGGDTVALFKKHQRAYFQIFPSVR